MRLLVIDDEPLVLETIALAFPEDTVFCCALAEDGIARFVSDEPDVVLCDIRLPDMSGMEAFEKMHRIDPKVPIVLMTGQGTAGTAIEAMQRGAFEYVLKPLDPDTLIPLIEDAAETSRMTRVSAAVPIDSSEDTEADLASDPLIGSCAAMQEVYRSIGRVARQNVTVLILGESGTGKEVLARALYQYSARPEGRFLAINCAAIPEALLESELFGHEKGAFTGADSKRIGKFELCNEGTLFLDEIGEMTPLMQSKLLRVLQDQTFERVGGGQTIKSSARLIAATNRNLEQAIADKEFRSDLFYRLNVYTIRLPPLRERGDDIRLLANYFLRRFSKQLGKQVTGYAPETLAAFMGYTWPGNVRELQSVVNYAVLEATGPVITPAFLPEKLQLACETHGRRAIAEHTEVSGGSENVVRDRLDFAQMTQDLLRSGCDEIHRELINVAERRIFAEVLEYSSGNLTQAAKRLGITRTTLRTRLEALGMSVSRTATTVDLK